MHHLIRRNHGVRLAGLRLSPTWIGIVLGLGALALGSALCSARSTARRRQEAEEKHSVATWEGEGGSPVEPAGAD